MAKDSKVRVVLADDHAVVRAGIREILEKSGRIQVLAEAQDGEEAQTLVSQHQPDVLVVDIQMPKRSGVDVTRWVRAEHRHVGVLVLTAYDDDPYVLAVLQAGANGYVLKTAAPDELIHAIEEVNQGKSVLDSKVAQKLLERISSEKDQGLVEELTDRELEVLSLAARGYTNKAIGVQLNISDRTVQGHLAHIFGKLQAGSRTEAVMRAVSLGWLPADLGSPED